ncbi:MAG: cytochrome c biogenesis protein CcsA [Methylacidiphilales bacterium]|nr:cytochrome c biogenesis protein CcsA [Candidatus Methylacidiphilales bacterium]
MDRILLLLSTFCFLMGFAYTMHALGARMYRASRFNFGAILCGFLFQTAFLMLRGHELKHCPLTNLFEVIIFLSWAVVLLYFLTGSAYRLSLAGAFTSPLVFTLQVFALLAPIDVPRRPEVQPNRWLELHAAVSVVAYGAFALAGVIGFMYLLQERQLKRHHLGTIFFHLPPIADLAVVLKRLLWTGFILLSAGLLSGFAVGSPIPKIVWGVAVWLVYGVILLAEKWKKFSPRRIALLSLAAFALTLATLWGLNFISAGAKI